MPLAAVSQRRLVHRAGVYLSDRFLQLGEPRLRRTGVDAENRHVLARKRIAEPVLQQTARTHYNRALPEVVQHAPETFAQAFGKPPRSYFFAQFGGRRKKSVVGTLGQPQLPPAVLDEK
ncbi:hypothetical protein SDC9_208978 [bioreactor metagenome]|uniref:Uncharacterized protein n=1 Tax=bioreactor metagenome TaxID=1076179 RepID=A0A645JLQ2_9ZZZZ